MSVTVLYLIPRTAEQDGTSEGTFTTVPPPEGTVIMSRDYGDTNSIETLIALLNGYKAELAAMKGFPVAIKLNLITQ